MRKTQTFLFMDKLKEFISQISLNKYWDKNTNHKINKKVYFGYINGELYTGYDRKKAYTKKGSLERSMVKWLASRYCIQVLKGSFNYKIREQVMETLYKMMPQLIKDGIIEIKEVELITK